MSAANKTLVEKANKTFETNDIEGLLSYCTDDFEWTMVGTKPIRGKSAIREAMGEGPSEPPAFDVKTMVAEGDDVICVGDMTMNVDGKVTPYAYCDVWRLRDGKIASLKAFLIATGNA